MYSASRSMAKCVNMQKGKGAPGRIIAATTGSIRSMARYYHEFHREDTKIQSVRYNIGGCGSILEVRPFSTSQTFCSLLFTLLMCCWIMWSNYMDFPSILSVIMTEFLQVPSRLSCSRYWILNLIWVPHTIPNRWTERARESVRRDVFALRSPRLTIQMEVLAFASRILVQYFLSHCFSLFSFQSDVRIQPSFCCSHTSSSDTEVAMAQLLTERARFGEMLKENLAVA